MMRSADQEVQVWGPLGRQKVKEVRFPILD